MRNGIKMAKTRGRPRAYDPDRALQAAQDVFWRKGFAETSLDELSAATGMNRPSLYAAFGDKKAIYLKTMERCRERMRVTIKDAFTSAVQPVAGMHAS